MGAKIAWSNQTPQTQPPNPLIWGRYRTTSLRKNISNGLVSHKNVDLYLYPVVEIWKTTKPLYREWRISSDAKSIPILCVA